MFKGGFAGKCKTDRVWQYIPKKGYWKCSGAIPWDQTVYLPEFDNDDHAGLIFPPYNFKDTQSDLPDYIFEKDPSSGQQLGPGFNSFEVAADQMSFLFSGSTDVDGINARCWNGTKGLNESQVHNSKSYLKSNFNVNATDWMNINVPSNPSEPVVGVEPVEHDGSYSCYWNVTTVGGEKESTFANRFVEIHKHLGKNDPSITEEIVVKNITEDSSHSDDLPGMTSVYDSLPHLFPDYEWNATNLQNKISSWN